MALDHVDFCTLVLFSATEQIVLYKGKLNKKLKINNKNKITTMGC